MRDFNSLSFAVGFGVVVVLMRDFNKHRFAVGFGVVVVEGP